MNILRTSAGRVWRLFLSLTIISAASLSTATAGFSDPTLSALVIHSGSGPIGFSLASLSPSFDPDETDYEITIPFEHDTIEIETIETTDPSFYIAITPTPPTIPTGSTVQYVITIEDLFFTPVNSYRINITREGANTNAALSHLVVSGANLNPGFAQLTFDYTASVPNSVSSITVTPTALSGDSTITVNGNPVASSNPSAAIPLPDPEGTAEIVILVNSGDGSVTKAYIVDITRLPHDPDSDRDGMLDDYETDNGLSVGTDDSGLDLDGDGLSNLYEYAFGSAADDPDDTAAPVMIRDGTGFLVISFNRAVDPADGTYEVEVSSNLSLWTNDVIDLTAGGSPESQVWRDAAGGTQRFVRVRFTSTL